MSHLKSYIYLSIILVVIVFLQWQCSGNQDSSAVYYQNHHDTVDYVGMETCIKCHSDVHNTFIETGMGQSMDVASRDKSSAEFTNHPAVYDSFSNFYYKPFWDKELLKIKEYRLNGRDTIHSRIEQVDYIIGSGQHTNSHLMEVNGYLYQMPITFYTQNKLWDLPPGFENGKNTRFSRTIKSQCLTCHNSFPTPIVGSENKYASIPKGIDCERCHGPGELHVANKMQGISVDTSKLIDFSIVNPKKLPYKLQTDICQRCHLQGNTVLTEGKTFYDFRPGMNLEDFMTVFIPRYKNNDDFIMASHADRIKASKCFIVSEEQSIQVQRRKYENATFESETVSSLTCISCHNPHKSVKVTASTQFNNACISCHEDPALKRKNSLLVSCTESEEKRMLVSNNCVSCHMPKSSALDIPHVSITDHKIQIPGREKTQSNKEAFVGLEAINNKNVSNELMLQAYLNQYEEFEQNPIFLDSAAYYLSLIKESPIKTREQVRLYFFKAEYQKLIALEKDIEKLKGESWTYYRLGEAYYQGGKFSQAKKWLTKAVAVKKYNLKFQNKLGTTLVQLNEFQHAKKVFEFIYSENPLFDQAINNLGYLALLERRYAEAKTYFNKAIDLDPDYALAYFNLCTVFMQQNQLKNAISVLDTLLLHQPSNNEAKQLRKRLIAQSS
ncbi:MAG: putative CXXCH cytochrome family protein [Sphingobacteriales bacterium]|jgi:predicted CXXCH cytochrome family protein